MKIDRLEFFHAHIPLISPFKTAANDIYLVETLLVKLTSGDTVGWGETTPGFMPTYSPESTAGAFLTAVRFLAPLIVGATVNSGEQLQQLLAPVKGNPFAKAGIDLAWWDCRARLENRPLYELIGGDKKTVKVGADFGILDNYDILNQQIEIAVDQGYQRVKLKFRPGWDLAMVESVRRQFPTLTLHVDCNSAYTLEDRALLKKLDDYDLAMIEQPLGHDDLIDHAQLRREVKTPVCLDESITSLVKTKKAIRIGACDWINIKPGRVGGLTNAIAINHYCMNNNIPCWIGGMLESSIGALHCLALATTPNINYPSDIFPTDRFFTADLVKRKIELSGPGEISMPDGPGIDITPDEEALRAATVTYQSVEPQKS